MWFLEYSKYQANFISTGTHKTEAKRNTRRETKRDKVMCVFIVGISGQSLTDL
jgi:hypothetical protein